MRAEFYLLCIALCNLQIEAVSMQVCLYSRDAASLVSSNALLAETVPLFVVCRY